MNSHFVNFKYSYDKAFALKFPPIIASIKAVIFIYFTTAFSVLE